MPDPDHPDFYKVLFKQVRSGLRRASVPEKVVGLLELQRAVESLEGLSLEWEDPENYEGNVDYLVTYFQRRVQQIQPSALALDTPPSRDNLDLRHGVAFVTVQDSQLRKRVETLRQWLWDTPDPWFPWLKIGYESARAWASDWLREQERDTELQEVEVVIRVRTFNYPVLQRHINDVAAAYAEDVGWVSENRPLTSALGASLLDVPAAHGHEVIVDRLLEGHEDQIDVPSIEVRRVGPRLRLPGGKVEVTVPPSGSLHDLREALVDIAMLTPWWDTGHALEYVLTGHPSLPPPFPQTASVPEGRSRRSQALTAQHVALLELVYHYPDANWTYRLETFNKWSQKVEGLRPFSGLAAVQAIRAEHARATIRAQQFSMNVEQSRARIDLVTEERRSCLVRTGPSARIPHGLSPL